MGLTGKYDFKGIKRQGAKLMLAALSTIPTVGAWIVGIPILHNMIEAALELFNNWLANQGLIVLNVGAITVQGQWDQKAFDKAIDQALTKLEIGRGQLTPAQIKAMDDAVIEAFRAFAPVTNHN